MFIRRKKEDAQEILKRVGYLETKGKTNDAIKELQKAIKLSPKDGSLYNRLGDLYVKGKDTKKSIEAYKKGVEVYKEDNFFRNALGLCKKTLRLDPENTEIYLVAADLHAELDERSEALRCLSRYAESPSAQNNADKVLKTIKQIEASGVEGSEVVEMMNEIYEKIGKDDLVRKVAKPAVKQEEVVEDITVLETPVTTPVSRPAKKVEIAQVKREPKLKKEHAVSDKESKVLHDGITHLGTSVKDIGSLIAQLRKDVRPDDIIHFLNTSLTNLSKDQKEAIAVLQRTLKNSLDDLQKPIKDLQQHVGKNTREMEFLLNSLNKALVSLSKNQASLTQKTNNNIDKMSTSFNVAIQKAVEDMKSSVFNSQKTTEKISSKFDETKKRNAQLLKASDEMKAGIQAMNDALTRFIVAQETKAKQHERYTLIIIGIIAAICFLSIISLFV